MSEFVRAFIFVAVAGGLLGYLVPKNKMEKPINFLLSAVIAIGLFTTFFVVFKGEYIEFNINEEIKENYTVKSVEYAVAKEIEKNIETLGGEVEKVAVVISEDYQLDEIKLYAKNKDEAFLERLKITLGVEDISWATN